MQGFDAFLLLSFGGPEAAGDVMPFLEKVTRGRGIPRERLLQVAEHYAHLGGKSPINAQNRDLLAAVGPALAAAGLPMRTYFGNRNWHPLLADTLRAMRDDGIKRAVTYVTSAYRSYSGCRQYLEDIERARNEIDGAPEVVKLRPFFDHPRFVAACAARLSEARRALAGGDRAHVLFTAHSLPSAMAATSRYEADLRETAERVFDLAGAVGSAWEIVYQSRSGPPSALWLEPDVLDHLRALASRGVRDVIVMPLGFLSDHVEILWDLDHDAAALARSLGMGFHRAATVGTHPELVAMIVDLVEERLGRRARAALCTSSPVPDVCAPDCCAYTPRRSGD